LTEPQHDQIPEQPTPPSDPTEDTPTPEAAVAEPVSAEPTPLEAPESPVEAAPPWEAPTPPEMGTSEPAAASEPLEPELAPEASPEPEPAQPTASMLPEEAPDFTVTPDEASAAPDAAEPDADPADVDADAPEPEADVAELDVAPAEPGPAPEPPPPLVTVRRSVSQEIARQLHAAGARYCFTVPAEPILPLLDDIAEAGIRVVTTRHEGGAAFMAEALSQSTGRPQVVATSRAVGAANAAVGIHTAQQDSAPMVALSGQVSRAYAGREAFQEANLVEGIGSMATWAAQIDTPDQTATVLGKAWRRLHTGRPGPVLLSVPVDVQTEEIELLDEPLPKAPGARGPAADRSVVSRAMKMLAASERGVIVAGAGVLRARATKRLVALSEALAVPVIAAWRRPDVFPNDHVNYLGMAGSWSAETVHQRLADADVILFVGTRLSEISTDRYRIPAKGTKWIHVDVQPRAAHAGLTAPTLSITADASRFLDSAWSDLRAAALDNEMRSRREARNAADREAYKVASAVEEGSWDGPGVHPGHIMAALRHALPDNATITTDAGNLAAFVSRHYHFRRAGTFLGATSGTMGFGLPTAIAASLMDPDRIAVAICGDGGFSTTMNELETAVREGAHPIAVVLDNQRYGAIAAQQLKEQRPTRTTDLGPVDFAGVARAHGALGFTVNSESEFEPALREAITSRQASVIHVAVDRGWLSADDTPLGVDD
jgi:acetolactate synthase-1/2/3 large subunit